MRVDDPNVKAPTPAGAEDAARADRSGSVGRAAKAYRPAEGATGAAPADSVSLSSLAGKVRQLAVSSPEREERIEELSRLVTEGKYQVDSEELSRSLIREAFDPAK